MIMLAPSMIGRKSDYLLRVWGREHAQAFSFLQPFTCGHKQEDGGAWALWFVDTQTRRRALEVVRENKGWIVATSDRTGPDSQTRCVASVRLRLPDGREFTVRDDFGYGYKAESACFMWEEGNHSCDCNRALQIHRQYPDELPDDEWDCGYTIKLLSIDIEREP